MGVEIDWRDVKGLVPSSVTIGTFSSALVKFVSDIAPSIKPFSSQPLVCFLSKLSSDQCNDQAYLRSVAGVRSENTLVFCFACCQAGHQSAQMGRKNVMRIDGSSDEDAPLHLMIKAYHDDIARGDTQAIKLNASEVRKILIPRPWYLKSVNPDCKRPFAAVRAEIVRRAHMYEDRILRRTAEDQDE